MERSELFPQTGRASESRRRTNAKSNESAVSKRERPDCTRIIATALAFGLRVLCKQLGREKVARCKAAEGKGRRVTGSVDEAEEGKVPIIGEACSCRSNGGEYRL